MDPKEIIPLIPDGFYDPSEIVLIGSHMEPSPKLKPSQDISESNMDDEDVAKLCSGQMRVRSDFVHQLNLTAIPKMVDDDAGHKRLTCPTIALIYAYGYEGHTYRLSKPRIMIVDGAGRPYKGTEDQGPASSLTGKLFMWRLSKHQQTISIEVESGDLEKLVLDANQPGNRAVNSYAAHMQMSHRGGKLS